MLGKLLDKILHEKEEEANLPEEKEEKKSEFGVKTLDLAIVIIIFIASIAVRSFFLFFVTDPQNAGDGWYGDTYHHWQIAYLTREVGVHQSFLRLWDLKGMEYFWGLLHPILMILLFTITGNVSIVNARVLSMIFGSLVLVVLYLIINKHWGRSAALASVFLAAVHPVGILNDTSGMLEPIGFFFLLLGILTIDTRQFVSGISWALASLVRAEAWLFGGLLLILSPRTLKKPGQFAKLAFSWFLPMLFYVKYLLDSTGNPIYPVWWNYLANAQGVWATEKVYTSYQLSVKPYLVIWFIVSIVLLGLVLWRNKSKGMLFLAFGFANWAFVGGFMGLTHYLTGFQPWFWYIRFFEFPYIFAGILLSLLLFYVIPKKAPLFHKLHLNWTLWIPIFLVGIFYQLFFWKPILEKYNSTRPMWEGTKFLADQISKNYEEGRILMHEGDPNITYALAYFHGIQGNNIISQMFDPFYYMEGDPYKNWGENRRVVLGWIKKEDIRLIYVDSARGRYTKLFEKEPQYFEYIGSIPNNHFLLMRSYPERIDVE